MDPFTTMRDALEMNFADVARLHDKVLSAAVAKFDLAASACPRANTDDAMALSRLAAAVKAIMLVNFPVAAREWHGPERD